MMVPDQMLRTFFVQHRATLAIILFLCTVILSLCVLFFEKGEVTFSLSPLISNKTLLDISKHRNGSLYYN